MRILITGGTGYLGRAIVAEAAARGHDVVVFARHASSAGLPGTPIDGDVRDGAALLAAARGVDAVCHTAALVVVWRPDSREFDDVNVGGLRHAIEAARTEGARLIYTSSFVARPPARTTSTLAGNDYLRTKVLADRVACDAADAGLPIVRLYPGVIFGPGIASDGNLLGRLIRDHIEGRLPGLVGADRIWSYAWVHDVAAAHVTAIESAAPGTSYDLGGENVSQIRPFELLRDWRGIRLPRRLPTWAASLAGMADELRARVTGRPPQLTRRTVEIFRHDWPLDSSRAMGELGYKVTPLAQGMREIINGEMGKRGNEEMD